MGKVLCIAAALTLTASSVQAGEIQFKPIDTQKLVVAPSKLAADTAAATIKLVGSTAAGAVEKNGYVKTINNLFGFRKQVTVPTQPGRSPFPTPALFNSTGYQNFNTPVAPSSTPTRR